MAGLLCGRRRSPVPCPDLFAHTKAMKKTTIILALVLVAGTCAYAAGGKKNKKKALPEVVAPAPVVPVSSADTVSYAAGIVMTNGLMEYLTGQLKVDTAYMADFVEGFKDALRRKDDPQYVARLAGSEIAKMVNERMLPSMKQNFEGTPDSINAEMFYTGFLAGVQKDSMVFAPAAATTFFEARLKADKDMKNEAMKAENAAWLAENAKKEGVVTLPSGLQYKVITAGDGACPAKEDKVTVRYEGKTIDGKVFDSSYTRNPDTTTFGVGQVIKGWTEALQLMPVGSKWELYIPQELAYGERGAGRDIKPFATLIFTVELVGVEKAAPAQPAVAPAAPEKPAAKRKTPTRTAAKKK